MRTAVVFPGQGSQAVGMGRELAQAAPGVMDLFDRANRVLGRDLKKIIFDGPEDELKETANTQPALYVASLAIYEQVKAAGIKPAAMAGHSLGEYSALAAAGVFSFEDGLRLVEQRAAAMADAGRQAPGTMAAILGLADELVREICREASLTALVEPANFNCPGQVVISGTSLGVETAMKLAQEKGAMKCVPLKVSGPFHSSLMKPAADRLKAAFSGVAWKEPELMVVANCSAAAVATVNEIQNALVCQIYQSVLWTESVQILVSKGIEAFVEVGPGRVLSGLIKKTAKDAKLANVEDLKSLEKFKVFLG